MFWSSYAAIFSKNHELNLLAPRTQQLTCTLLFTPRVLQSRTTHCSLFIWAHRDLVILIQMTFTGSQRRRKFGMLVNHDDIIKWQHFPRYWPFVRGNHRSPHMGQWRGALMFSVIYVWINGGANNHEAGDLIRYRAHGDDIVMWVISILHNCIRLYLWYILRCLIILICWIVWIQMGKI